MELSTCYRNPTGQQYDFCQLVWLVLCGSVLKEKEKVNKSVKWSGVKAREFFCHSPFIPNKSIWAGTAQKQVTFTKEPRGMRDGAKWLRKNSS